MTGVRLAYVHPEACLGRHNRRRRYCQDSSKCEDGGEDPGRTTEREPASRRDPRVVAGFVLVVRQHPSCCRNFLGTRQLANSRGPRIGVNIPLSGKRSPKERQRWENSRLGMAVLKPDFWMAS